MDWWQILLVLLTSIAGGVITGVLLSYLILRFIKKSRSIFLNDIISGFARKFKSARVTKEPLKIIRADLLDEVRHNRKIASESVVEKPKLFESRVWYANPLEADRLTTNLRDELEQVYTDILVANSLVQASTKFSSAIPLLDENYNKLCARIAERLDRIILLIEYSDSTKLLTEPDLTRSTVVAIQPQIGPMSIETLIYLLAIAVAQVVCIFYVIPWGILYHIVILTVIVVRSALAGDSLRRRLLLSFSLVPLLRIVSLAVPLADIPPILLYYLSYGPVLVAAVFLMGTSGFTLEQVGLSSKRFRIQLAVVLTGIVFGLTEYFILLPEPMIAELTLQGVWLPALILLVCAGFIQEFVFRGVIQTSSTEVFGGWGVLYVSLLFALTYVGFVPVTDLAFVFVVSLFFGWVVRRTGSLLGVALSRGIGNIVLYLIAPFFF